MPHKYGTYKKYGTLKYEKYGTLAESMTHYLFTEMLIPSQRKIIFENVELDMVIPNTLELQKNSNNTIVIFFVKTSHLEQITQKKHEIITKVNEHPRRSVSIWATLQTSPEFNGHP